MGHSTSQMGLCPPRPQPPSGPELIRCAQLRAAPVKQGAGQNRPRRARLPGPILVGVPLMPWLVSAEGPKPTRREEAAPQLVTPRAGAATFPRGSRPWPSGGGGGCARRPPCVNSPRPGLPWLEAEVCVLRPGSPPDSMGPRPKVPSTSEQIHPPHHGAASASAHQHQGSLPPSQGGWWGSPAPPTNFSLNIRYYFLFVSSLDAHPTSFLPP